MCREKNTCSKTPGAGRWKNIVDVEQAPDGEKNITWALKKSLLLEKRFLRCWKKSAALKDVRPSPPSGMDVKQKFCIFCNSKELLVSVEILAFAKFWNLGLQFLFCCMGTFSIAGSETIQLVDRIAAWHAVLASSSIYTSQLNLQVDCSCWRCCKSGKRNNHRTTAFPKTFIGNTNHIPLFSWPTFQGRVIVLG